MVDTETFLKSADAFKKPERGQYRHSFGRPNYLLYHLAQAAANKAGDKKLVGALQQQYDSAIAKLKAAADLEISPGYEHGILTEVRVRVKNVRAGHNLPTSLTNVREMWLEVTAKDRDGNVLLSSGSLAEGGSLRPGTRQFNSEGMGKDFHFAIDPWVVTAFSRHDTIPPRGYRDVSFGIRPARSSGSVTVEARLRYRQADQKVAEKLLAAVPSDIDLAKTYGITAVPQLPIVDMVVKTVQIKGRE
jgi:hypothetical protein